MPLVLGLFDWIMVAVLVLVMSGAALLIAIVLLRRHVASELEILQSQLSRLERRLPRPERQNSGTQTLPRTPVPHERAQSPPPQLSPERTAMSASETPSPVVQRTMETLTQDAAAALASLDAFRRFAQKEGGTGYTVSPGAQRGDPITGGDPVSAADLWAIPFEDTLLFFPGYNLRRTQSSLLADAGRMARDRLGWLFDIEAGEQLLAFKPAIRRSDEHVERGSLTLPFDERL